MIWDRSFWRFIFKRCTVNCSKKRLILNEKNLKKLWWELFLHRTKLTISLSCMKIIMLYYYTKKQTSREVCFFVYVYISKVWNRLLNIHGSYFSFTDTLFDNFLCDTVWYFFVWREFHCVTCSSLSHWSEWSRISEHFW